MDKYESLGILLAPAYSVHHQAHQHCQPQWNRDNHESAGQGLCLRGA